MSQGIFGIIDFNRRIDRPDDLAATMGTFLESQGSEKAKVSCKWDHHYILGMKRLCQAPYQQNGIVRSGELGALCLMNGEMHNYESVLAEDLSDNPHCDGDLDLTLHLYDRYGPDFAQKFNGLFCLAILDEKKKSFFLLNDRFGMAHQVYWTTVNGRFCFATHLKTLLTGPGIPREINQEGLNLFLKYSYIPSPFTIFQGIKKLPPGHLLVFKDGEATHDCYWEFGQDGRPVAELQEAISAYTRLLQESISRRLGSNGDVGILLSGGLDSSANVALAAQCTNKSLKTFAVGFEDPTFDERPYAKIVAEHFGTEHHEYTISGKEIEDLPNLIWHLEEPYFEFGLFLTYLGMAAAKNEVDVILGGEGADQMFGTGGFAGGLPTALRFLLLKSHLLKPASSLSKLLHANYFYERDNWAFKFRLLWNRVIDLNHWYFYGYDENELANLYGDEASSHVPQIFSDSSNGRHLSFESLYHETHVNQDIKHYANENVMVKSGRMADMLDLTLRVSYLDTDVADFLVSLDFRFKRSGHLLDHITGNIQTKFLHRKAMEDLLPREIMTKPKQGGFVPVMIFLGNSDLRKRIYGHLLHSVAMKAHFNRNYLNALFTNYERIQGNNIYWHNFYNSKANRILFLLTFDIWHHFYMENAALEVTPLPLSEYLLSE